MKLKINDPDYGDMELDIDHDTADLVDKDSIVVFRNKDVKFTLAQEEGSEPSLYAVMFLEQGEYERNYDQLDWEYNWPCEVAFVPADAHRFGAHYGENVSASSHWDEDDFFYDKDEDVESHVNALTDKLARILRDSDLTESKDGYYWVMRNSISPDELSNMLDLHKGECVYFNACKHWCYEIRGEGAEQNDPLLTFVCNLSDLITLAAENLDKDVFWNADDYMHHTFVPCHCGDSDVQGMSVYEYAEAVASVFLNSHKALFEKLINTPIEGSPQRELPSWAWGYLDVTDHSGCVWHWAGTGYFDRWDSSANAGVLYYCPKDIKDAIASGVSEDDIKKCVKQSLNLALHMMDDFDSPNICNVIHYNVLGKPIEDCGRITENYGWQYDNDMKDNIECILRGGKLEKVEFTIVHTAQR